jgi:hypothetical protein
MPSSWPRNHATARARRAVAKLVSSPEESSIAFEIFSRRVLAARRARSNRDTNPRAAAQSHDPEHNDAFSQRVPEVEQYRATLADRIDELAHVLNDYEDPVRI